MLIAETRTFGFRNVFALAEKPFNCRARGIGVATIFDWGGPKSKLLAMTSSEIFERGTFCGTKIEWNTRSRGVIYQS